MSDCHIQEAPGWWSNLVQAACDDCGWRGPVRDLNKPNGEALAKCDRNEHECS